MELELYYAYLRLLIAFPLVIALAYWGLRYLLPRFAPAWGMGKKIRVVERTALHSRAFLYVVKVGENYFLLAATHSSITLLKDLGRSWEENFLPAETEAGIETEPGDFSREPELPGWSSFAGLLKKLKEKGNQWKGPGGRG